MTRRGDEPHAVALDVVDRAEGTGDFLGAVVAAAGIDEAHLDAAAEDPGAGEQGGACGACSAIRPLRRMREVSLVTLTGGLRH
ncbi:hypothetical protein [Cryobacterium sp. 10C3]|uniref:hypothetical protein n=1 Tax=Cryobacterium sp. 10C3 TaxID=3048577 RepID=UPI002AB39E23|nr:hypothetical protein [Cryobacterium sp. 10C3]MDY7557060.1 hypothetical protein [Cryobacterium sp. 10C3]